MIRKELGKIKNESLAKRYRRKLSIRRKVSGSADRPRVCVTKSNKHLSVQVLDDNSGKTMFSVQTFGKKAVPGGGKTVDGAKAVGVKVAEGLKAKNISSAVFDRSGYKYTGVVSALAESIRENGIQI